MCLILIGCQVHPAYPLVIAANRDEYFTRPAARAGFWRDYPAVLAGRDLQAGGTWLGIDASGRVAAVTNYHEPSRRGAGTAVRSRGFLVRDYLTGGGSARDYMGRLARDLDAYDGFNLVAGDAQALWFISTYLARPRQINPGIHGISNGDLDHPWPKVLLGKARFTRLLEGAHDLDEAALFALLADRSVPELPADAPAGMDRDTQRLLAPIFVHGKEYGTRCSTVVWWRRDGKVRFVEKRFDAAGKEAGKSGFEFTAASDPDFPRSVS